jgi:hypothetical protein
MNYSTLRRRVHLATGILAVALAAVAGGSRYRAWRVERAARARCVQLAAQAGDRISAGMAALERVARDLAAQLESGQVAPERAEPAVVAALRAGPAAILRAGVLFRPGAAGPDGSGAWAAREGPRVRPHRFEAGSDYRTRVWLRRHSGASGWEEPDLAHRGGGLVVVYARPFRLPGAPEPSGLVRLDVALEGIQALVDQLEVGLAGYGFLLSARGVYLDDPREELVQERRTIREMADRTRDPGREQLARLVQGRQSGFTESVSGVTGQKTWVALRHLPALDWSLGLVFYREDLRLEPSWGRWATALETSLALGLVLGLLFLGLGPRGGHPARRWWVVGAGSAAILAGSALVLREAEGLAIPRPDSEFQVMDSQSLEHFQSLHHTRKVGGENHPVTFIPTGVAVQTLEAAGPGLMKMTGQIWQRFPRGTPREQRGLLLPEATGGEVGLGLERAEGDSVVQFYPYRVVLRTENDSDRRYPFDRTRVRLRILPRDFLAPVLPVPDLDSYPLPVPRALPGVDPEIELPGWDLEATDFSYAQETYTTRFGAAAAPGPRKEPELLFDVTLRRRFLGPFIVAFLPILAVAALLFLLVLTVSLQADRMKATGYSCLNFLRTTIALFFSLVVAQFSIRARVAADGVILLEWYYFIMYGAILAVSANALVVALGGPRILRRGDNALAKLAFWPVLLGAFYLNTLMYLR